MMSIQSMQRERTSPSAKAAGVFGGKSIRCFIAISFLILLSSCETIKHIVYTYDPLNFHPVKEGIIYRSGQPRGEDLRRLVEEYGIRSVVNLRGAHPGQHWYDHELAVSRELGLERVDIAMSASRLPHKEDLVVLLDGYQDLPRPLLVHCEAGADRSGEAIAIFGLEYLNWSKRKALGALHPRFGHFPDLRPAKTYMIRDVYQGEAWARSVYDPCKQDYRYYNKEKFCANRR